MLLLQKDLESTVNGKFVDTSLSETLYQLILLGQSKRASKVKSDFKVPDKRYWWIKIKALVQMKDWPALDKLAKEKKSPIGYEPFVEECMQAGAMDEAERYIPKVVDLNTRANLYQAIGNQAAAEATRKLIKQ